MPPRRVLRMLLALVASLVGGGLGVALATAQDTAPRLGLSLNATSFRPGETLVLSATVTPGSTPVSVDAYVAVELPDRSLLFFQGNDRFTPVLQPIATGVTPAPVTGEIFRYPFTGAEPVGPYRWLAAFTATGTLQLLGDVVEVPFTFLAVNASPVAQAGGPHFPSPGIPVTLDGSASTDPDGDALTYSWAFLAVPTRSRVTNQSLSPNTMAIMPAFTPDVVGQYRLSLTVDDAHGGRANAAVLVNAQVPDTASPSCNGCTGSPGHISTLMVRVSDDKGGPVPIWPVDFARLLGNGVFVDDAGNETPEPVRRFTDDSGTATARFKLGEQALQTVVAQVHALPNNPVIFRMTLGPLAGNGTEPVNIAAGGARGYTANSGTNNVSVFDTTGQSFTVLDAVDLTRVQTEFGAGSILGVAVNTSLARLYVYGPVDTAAGASLVLLPVDTTTNRPVEPADPDGDGVPGLTLFTTPAALTPGATSLSPGSILGLDFANLLTVDEARRRVYAVLPGVVEAIAVNGETVPVRIVNGALIVLEDRGGVLVKVGQPIPVGEVPTGVAVNSQTNRIYVTNRGFHVGDDPNDTVTVIDGDALAVSARITVGQVPLGVRVDERHNVIYVANLYGAETLPSAGAVSVINGQSNRVLQTIPTSGTSDLAVLVGAETAFLDDNIVRIYVNDGTIIDCDMTRLTAPTPCLVLPGLLGLHDREKFAINGSNTLLFGASRYDNDVKVFDLASNRMLESTIQTGASVNGLAVDTATGTTYVSDFLGDKLFAVSLTGDSETVPLRDLGFHAPGQVQVDETRGRIYVLSPNSTGGASGLSPLLALQRTTHTLAAILKPHEWGFDFPQALAIDERRNLLYIVASSRRTNKLVVLDGTRFAGQTDVNQALVTHITVGPEDGTELAQGVAVDAERNLIYVTRVSLANGCDPNCNALVVLRGPEFDVRTRTLQRAPHIVATIPGIGLQYGGGRRNMALDPARQLLYVTGAFDCLSGSICAKNGSGFGSTALTVLDALQIVDAAGQVTPNPAQAVLGVIPIKVFPGPDGQPLIPIVADYNSPELAFNTDTGLLYVVTRSSAPFKEGLTAVINGALVLDAERHFLDVPHAAVPGALRAQIATIPVGLEPGFIAVDVLRNRLAVTNQSPATLSVLRGLSIPEEGQ